MAFNEMSLPIDIPWKRMGVAEDMIDKANDDKQPAKWRSSIAAFYHEPSELPPDYCGRKITYLKIVCTITNHQESGPEATALDFLHENDSEFGHVRVHRDTLARSYPCYGALLQVSVLPPSGSETKLHDYPYISAFEPKKREMYETVTESGEVLSQSANSTNVGKNTTNTNSFENYDLDTGSSKTEKGSGSFLFGAVSGSGEKSTQETGQWGTIDRQNSQTQKMMASDASREKRESFSHSTNINNIYSLLQGYHLGTNRAMFFLQPRPHIQNTKFTFIQGPRKLEGIQEFFFIINRPNSIPGFCVEAALETAHVHTQYTYKPLVIPESELYLPENLSRTPEAIGINFDDPESPFYNYSLYKKIEDWNRCGYFGRYAIDHISQFPNPPVHDEDRYKHWIFHYSIYNSMISLGINPHDIKHIKNKFAENIGDDLVLLFNEYESEQGNFFVVGRKLDCCVTPSEQGEVSSSTNISPFEESASIVYEEPHFRQAKYSTSASMKNQSTPNDFIQNINAVLEKSLGSTHRIPYGKISLLETNFMIDEMRNLIGMFKKTGIKDKPLREVRGFSQYITKGLGKTSGIKTILDFANIKTNKIVKDLGTSDLEARKIHSKILTEALQALEPKTISKQVSLPNASLEKFKTICPRDKMQRLIKSTGLLVEKITLPKKDIITGKIKPQRKKPDKKK